MALIQYMTRFPLRPDTIASQSAPLPWKVPKWTHKPIGITPCRAAPTLSVDPTFSTPAAVCLFYTPATFPTLLLSVLTGGPVQTKTCKCIKHFPRIHGCLDEHV